MKKLLHATLFIASSHMSCLGMEVVQQAAQAAAAEYPLDNPLVQDVVAKFDAMPSEASAQLHAWDSDSLIPKAYNAKKAKVVWAIILNALKIKTRTEGLSHFQSIKRIPGTNYLYLDGGDAVNKVADLFIVQMASEPTQGSWHSVPSDPEQGDRIIRKIELFRGAEHGHPSGMDICGKYLVIPLEGTQGSTATFFDISNPLDPERLATNFTVNGGCMAMALTRLANLRYLIGAMMNTNRIDLYYSKTINLADGFYEKPVVYDLRRDASRSNYQNINFITQTDNTLFMVATQNSLLTAPIINGKNYADLFRINLDLQKLEARSLLLAQGQEPDQTDLAAQTLRIRQKKMTCGDHANFNAGGTMCILDSEHIALYATPHWPREGKIRFTSCEH